MTDKFTFPESPVTGDICNVFDNETSELNMYIYNGTAWMPLGASAPSVPSDTSVIISPSVMTTTGATLSSSSVTTTTGGTGGYYGTGTTGTWTTSFPTTTTKKENPFKDDNLLDGEVQNRDIYLARTLFDHVENKQISLYSSQVTCGCGKVSPDENAYILHLAHVAIEAADTWDQLIMAGDSDDDI